MLLEASSVRYFREAASAGSIRRGGRGALVSPSALTRSIAQLEKLLGTKLLERRARRHADAVGRAAAELLPAVAVPHQRDDRRDRRPAGAGPRVSVLRSKALPRPALAVHRRLPAGPCQRQRLAVGAELAGGGRRGSVRGSRDRRRLRAPEAARAALRSGGRAALVRGRADRSSDRAEAQHRDRRGRQASAGPAQRLFRPPADVRPRDRCGRHRRPRRWRRTRSRR